MKGYIFKELKLCASFTVCVCMLKIHMCSRTVIRQPDSSRVCSGPQPEVWEAPEPQPAGRGLACHLRRGRSLLQGLDRLWSGPLWSSRQWTTKHFIIAKFVPWQSRLAWTSINKLTFFKNVEKLKKKTLDTLKNIEVLHLAVGWCTFNQPKASWGDRQQVVIREQNWKYGNKSKLSFYLQSL